jgi:hypothetical protein
VAAQTRAGDGLMPRRDGKRYGRSSGRRRFKRAGTPQVTTKQQLDEIYERLERQLASESRSFACDPNAADEEEIPRGT